MHNLLLVLESSMLKPPPKMTVILNGKPAATDARDLSHLIAELDFGAMRVATALNGVFVPEGARAKTPIKDGDRIEVVTPRNGG